MQILADAMGLGKTVMTIALILSRRGHGIPDGQMVVAERGSNDSNNSHISSNSLRRKRGGTLIVCPMALLSQWKVNPQLRNSNYMVAVIVS